MTPGTWFEPSIAHRRNACKWPGAPAIAAKQASTARWRRRVLFVRSDSRRPASTHACFAAEAAVIIKVSMSDNVAAHAQLDELVPRVSAMPGFVAGYWIALSEGKGTAIHVFDSDTSAQALIAQVESSPAGAVTTESVEVGRVIARA